VHAHHAAVGVHFVDDQEPEGRELGLPLGGEGQDAVVEHVGVGDDQSGARPRPRPGLAAEVAVVARHQLGVEPEGRDTGTQPRLLIGGQRLGGEHEDRAPALASGLQRRRLEHQRLARGRPGCHDDVSSTRHAAQGGSLVAVRSHAQRREDLIEGRDRLVVEGAAARREEGVAANLLVPVPDGRQEGMEAVGAGHHRGGGLGRLRRGRGTTRGHAPGYRGATLGTVR
jgi:hypothetical protein